MVALMFTMCRSRAVLIKRLYSTINLYTFPKPLLYNMFLETQKKSQLKQSNVVDIKATFRAIMKNHYLVTPIEVEHRKNFFFIRLKGYGRASIKYEIVDGVMVIKHTFVPKIAEGRGLGIVLVKKALEYAEEIGYQVKVECKFVRYIIDKYIPEFKELEVQELPNSEI